MEKPVSREKYAKVIGEYNDRAIEKVRWKCAEKVDVLYSTFPFDGFTEKRLRLLLRKYRVFPNHGCYDDCYSAGMMAYLYSIHRCAYMGYKNVEGYIAKMLRIYLICAIIVYKDSQNLCHENGFQEIRIDQDDYVRV